MHRRKPEFAPNSFSFGQFLRDFTGNSELSPRSQIAQFVGAES
jgi:hypothetical protein